MDHMRISGTEPSSVIVWKLKCDARVYNFFLPLTLYIQQYEPSLNMSTIFKRILLGIELRATFEERENK